MDPGHQPAGEEEIYPLDDCAKEEEMKRVYTSTKSWGALMMTILTGQWPLLPSGSGLAANWLSSSTTLHSNKTSKSRSGWGIEWPPYQPPERGLDAPKSHLQHRLTPTDAAITKNEIYKHLKPSETPVRGKGTGRRWPSAASSTGPGTPETWPG